MQEILELFHVDGQMLVAQLINFAVLMVLIMYVVVRPLRKMMAEREAVIQEGVDNAVHAETKLSAAVAESEHIVTVANEEAYRIRAEANKTAEHTLEVAQTKMHQESLRSQRELEDQLKSQRENDLTEFKRESVEMTVSAVEVLLKQKFSDVDYSRNHLSNLAK